MTITQSEIERWDRVKALLERQVEMLNAALDLTDADHQHRVTFGYIGNGRFASGGWNLDGVLWSVFLPHPGQVGTADDQLGGVQHHDAIALTVLTGQLVAFRRGVEFANVRAQAGAR